MSDRWYVRNYVRIIFRVGITRLGVAILYIAAAAPWIPLTEKITGRKDLLRLPIYGCLSQKNTAHDSSVYHNVDVDPMSGKPRLKQGTFAHRALLLTMFTVHLLNLGQTILTRTERITKH